jgi:O-acetyl-ADP-ribose deacetylase (regulator of RNase III)
MVVKVFVGSLCDAPAEVLCTSTNTALSAFKGADAELRRRGGAELREASSAILEREEIRTGHRYLPTGTAAASGPGALDVQAVVHCVAFDAQGASPDIITTCTQNTLITIGGLKPHPKNIAIPVLAADNGKYDFDQALRLMAEVLRSTQDIHLDTVWIVVKDEPQAGAAQRTLAELLGNVEIRVGAGSH